MFSLPSQALLTLTALISSVSAGYSYGLAAPLYGHAVAAPLAYGGALVGAPAYAAPLHATALHAPALAAPLLAGAAVQTGDYSRVATVHGVQPGYPTLAAPLGAIHAAPLHATALHAPALAAPLHAGLVAPAVAASYRLGGAVVSPYGVPVGLPAGLRLIK